jgi:ornithine cyclodeaminase/alanine dehydrogenase-like protein (mu-crystallin family)
MKTLLLARSQVEALVDPSSLVDRLRAAFVAYSAASSDRARRVHSVLPAIPGSATVLFPGTTPNVPAYAVKVHAKFPSEAPSIRGVLCLHDLATGGLLAVMDSTYLTAIRTGIAGTLAAHVLARLDSDLVAVIGAGVQGTFQLRSLARLRSLRRVWVYDIVRERAETFAQSMANELALPVEAASSTLAAVRQAGIVLAATWSRTPFILPGMLATGAHVATLGPDEPGKAEVAADLIRAGLFVCDDRALAVELGAVDGVGLGPESVDAELGEVLAGRHPGRTSSDQITIYGGVGLAFQDAVAAWQVYDAARARGLRTDILPIDR